MNIRKTKIALFTIIIGATATIAGCITPLQQCINQADAQRNTYQIQLNQLQAQHNETRRTIERGYAVHRQVVEVEDQEICYKNEKRIEKIAVKAKQKNKNTKKQTTIKTITKTVRVPYLCETTEYQTIETPVSINVDERRRQLVNIERRMNTLHNQIAKITPQTEQNIQQCHIIHGG